MNAVTRPSDPPPAAPEGHGGNPGGRLGRQVDFKMPVAYPPTLYEAILGVQTEGNWVHRDEVCRLREWKDWLIREPEIKVKDGQPLVIAVMSFESIVATEAAAGLDIVAEQIRLAAGERVGRSNRGTAPRRSALVCDTVAALNRRANTSDDGPIQVFLSPHREAVRVDASVSSGWTPPDYYVPHLVTLVTWGNDHADARDRMLGVLGELAIECVKTTIPDCNSFPPVSSAPKSGGQRS